MKRHRHPSRWRLLAAAALLAPAAVQALTVMVAGPAWNRAAFYTAYGISPDASEGFETLPMPHDSSVPSFSQNGATYAALTASPLVVHSPGSHGQFASVLMPTTSSVLTGNGYDHMRVSFVQPLAMLALDVYSNGRGPTTVEFFDGAVLRFGFVWDEPAAIYTLAWFSDDFSITHLVFDDTFGEVINGGIDNLDWVYAPVPEPASWALWGAGLLALVQRARRHRPPARH